MQQLARNPHSSRGRRPALPATTATLVRAAQAWRGTERRGRARRGKAGSARTSHCSTCPSRTWSRGCASRSPSTSPLPAPPPPTMAATSPDVARRLRRSSKRRLEGAETDAVTDLPARDKTTGKVESRTEGLLPRTLARPSFQNLTKDPSSSSRVMRSPPKRYRRNEERP